MSTNLTTIPKRRIGTYTGTRRGPLVVVLTAMHGNEPAGVAAMEEVFQMLEREPSVNPEFEFAGRIVGLIGNRMAYATRQRFIERDLNRLWHPDSIHAIRTQAPSKRDPEGREAVELFEAIQAELIDYQPDTLVLVDLHTTSAAGGIFTIPLEQDPHSLELARELHAPVVLGLLQGLGGTMLHFAAANGFKTQQWPESTQCVAFEAGQHDDPLSVSRAISAVINAMRGVGCVRPEDVDNRHDAILREYAAQLPEVTRITHVQHLSQGDGFLMRPGYANFQRIKAGEHLADTTNGPILAPHDGRILMPLYQPQGSDGFFVVEEVEG
jgi:succinylglutamate desuccinylase